MAVLLVCGGLLLISVELFKVLLVAQFARLLRKFNAALGDGLGALFTRDRVGLAFILI